jgi:hypothetical protein
LVKHLDDVAECRLPHRIIDASTSGSNFGQHGCIEGM